MIKNRILEMCHDVSGRRKLKIALHEIYADESKWNNNGITYLEQYTRDNADTVKGMPLCAEFLDDDKKSPFGHGLTDMNGSIPLFEDSVQVGTFEDWEISDIEIDGEIHKCLIGIGYINENRYPNFCSWIDEQLENNNRIFGSIEFSGTKENGEILYRDGYKEKGRIPTVYDYTGYCIVSIRPADNSAMLLEIEESAIKKEHKIEDYNDVFEKNTLDDDMFLSVINEMFDEQKKENLVIDEVFADSKHEESEKNEFDDVFGGNVMDMIDVF